MDLQGMKLFQMLGARMEHLGKRQSVISENISNADTPGYRARNVEELDFESEFSGPHVDMSATDPGHMQGTVAVDQPRIVETEGAEMSPNGNSVVIEEQMLEAADVRMQHNSALEIYRGHSNMLRSVLGK